MRVTSKTQGPIETRSLIRPPTLGGSDSELVVDRYARSQRQLRFTDRSRTFALSARDAAVQVLNATRRATGRAFRSAQDVIAQQAAFDQLNEALEHTTEILAIQHARISSLEERLDRIESTPTHG
jgi:hypothetical protein